MDDEYISTGESLKRLNVTLLLPEEILTKLIGEDETSLLGKSERVIEIERHYIHRRRKTRVNARVIKEVEV